MKNSFFIVILVLILGCGKDKNVVSRQGITLEFTKDYVSTGTSTINKPFNVATMLIWKSEGKKLQYNGPTNGNNAFDAVTQKNVLADYTFSNIKNQLIELPIGQFFITIITDDVEAPKSSYSSTNFTIQAGQFVSFKKNVTNMTSNSGNNW